MTDRLKQANKMVGITLLILIVGMLVIGASVVGASIGTDTDIGTNFKRLECELTLLTKSDNTYKVIVSKCKEIK